MKQIRFGILLSNQYGKRRIRYKRAMRLLTSTPEEKLYFIIDLPLR